MKDEIRHLCSPSFLKEISEEKAGKSQIDFINNLLQCHEMWKQVKQGMDFPKIKSLIQLERLVWDLTREFEQFDECSDVSYGLNDRLFSPPRYPSPPFRGNDQIIPIETLQELVQEEKNMRIYVGDYSEKIFSGNYYCYKVTAVQNSNRVT